MATYQLKPVIGSLYLQRPPCHAVPAAARPLRAPMPLSKASQQPPASGPSTRSLRIAPQAAAAAATAPISLAVSLTPAHGYVALSLVFAIFVHQIYMVGGVARARKKYNVAYPALYAEGSSKSSLAFNCVQRGHQNSLEGYAGFLILLLVAGLKYPLTAAISGVVYSLGKVVYFHGYATGDPMKRLRGSFSYFGLLTLLGCVIRLGFSLILSA
mmetsp:Transcript_10886/g.30832  ORF Transcript_10886/g.30832 Transcript_10886/m.30832 type:complete len:213 (-) Transcript_10886:129-767(-)|eukprot:CAMPEP_0117677802 /NCGR_PEP_ID=MMETSP0804-20121206/16938_1 /TAXON_ID=1074897 /ORGANISM="Tetraselmis astigmatica, Strain CCMP880" /LENGTH=212 /DNA_ID=CAMNT_0005487107 /DNA_START=60 /DNA_END=698 /DNA_ORIENTATION=+